MDAETLSPRCTRHNPALGDRRRSQSEQQGNEGVDGRTSAWHHTALISGLQTPSVASAWLPEQQQVASRALRQRTPHRLRHGGPWYLGRLAFRRFICRPWLVSLHALQGMCATVPVNSSYPLSTPADGPVWHGFKLCAICSAPFPPILQGHQCQQLLGITSPHTMLALLDTCPSCVRVVSPQLGLLQYPPS